MTPFARRLSVLLLSAAEIGGCAGDHLHREAVKAFEHGAYEEAIASLEHAVNADPSNLPLRLELRQRREAAVQQLIGAGDSARANGNLDRAATSYGRVLRIEPGNSRALRGIETVEADLRHAERIAKAAQLFTAKRPEPAELEARAVLAEDPGYAPAIALLSKVELARGPIPPVPRLKTNDDRPVSLQFRDAPTKMVFEVLARQTGLNFIFDKEVKTEGKTTIFVNQVPVEQAIDLILSQNQLGRQVLSDNIVLIYPNTAAKQKDYRDEIVHTFYLTNAAPKDAESLLKTVLGTKTVFIDEHSSTLVMRDTPERVRMAEKLIATVDVVEPEVIMEVEVLEITHSVAEQLGINYPGNVSFTPTKPLNSTAAAVSGGLALSDIGKQTANTIAISSLGISVDLLKTVGASNVLSSPRVRARNKEKAKILVGNRLPVVTSGTSATVGGTFSTSNVQYIDVGLTLEVQPTIHNDGNVAIKVALEVSSILKQINVPTGNGGTTLAYEVGTRNTSTLLELRDGETQVLAGLIQDNDQHTSTHIPGLGDLPILGRLFGSNGTSRDKNEIVLSITPRIIRMQPRPSSDTTEFWFGSETQSRSAPFVSTTPIITASMPSGAGPVVPGAVSFASGGAAETAPAAKASSGPRALPERIAATAVPPPPANASADAKKAGGKPAETASAEVAAPAPAPVDGKPRVTIEGPDTAKVGDEVSVSVKLTSTSALGRIRAQVGFDPSALQLVSADPGDLASGVTPKVELKAGGVQVELVGGNDAPVSGSGTLIDLRLRVVAARPASIATQVVLIGRDGVALGATQATALNISVVK